MIDFPLWLRLSHFFNVIFITLLIRSGIEILSAHPKLYTNDNAIDGKEWIRFTRKKMPKDALWTSTEEEEPFSSWIALPGKNNLGLGRHWHFFSAVFWLANGLAYGLLLFATGEWARLLPTSWDIFPQAISSMQIYISGHFPPPSNPYNALQQLTYAGVVFLLGPFMIATGAAMSPAIGARFSRFPRIFGGRQLARSLHFLSMLAFVLFTLMHTVLVITERFPENMGNIVFGSSEGVTIELAVILLGLYLTSVLVVHFLATKYSLALPREVQKTLGFIANEVTRKLLRQMTPRKVFSKSQVSPYFRINGRPPETEEYERLEQEAFRFWRLRVHGSVNHELELSLDDLRAMKKQRQITEHSCIQGWTAIAEWAGVPLSEVLKLCEPLPSARYVVFHSHGLGERRKDGGKESEYYEAIEIELARHEQTILAYEMNGEPLPIAHGAPLRLRVETQLGYKMVKWLRSIEFVESYETIGEGQGGYREDVQYYGMDASI